MKHVIQLKIVRRGRKGGGYHWVVAARERVIKAAKALVKARDIGLIQPLSRAVRLLNKAEQAVRTNDVNKKVTS